MSKKGENIYKRKDGRWEGRYIKGRKPNGTIHYGYIYDYSYKNAKQKLILMKSFHQENYGQNSLPIYCGSLNQWATHWLEIVKKRVKISTFVSYTNKYRQHIQPSLGEIALADLTTEKINLWLRQLETKLSISSTRVMLQVLRTCLEDAVKKGLITRNPCKGATIPKAENKKVQALTKIEQNRLYKSARSNENGLPVILALETGLRIGEISGLKWKDIDFSSKLLHVRRTVQRIQSLDPVSQTKTIIIEHSPKSSSSERTIPLSPNLYQLLRAKRKMAIGSHVFGDSSPCEPRIILYWFKKICQDASLKNIHFHALRHTFATRCLEKGVTIVTISALLGHHSSKMTLDIYLNSFLSEKRKAIRLISSKG